MPRVPSTGPINVKGIFSELNEDDYTAQNIDGETNVSFTKLTNGTYDTINTDGWSDSTNNTSGETGSGIASQPHELSEWRGYDHTFSASIWGTPGSITTNASGVFNASVENDDAFECIIAQAVKISTLPSLGQITYQFITTSDGHYTTEVSNTTNIASISYTGTLSSLDIRMRFESVKFYKDANYGATNYGVYAASAKNNGVLNATHCSDVTPSATGQTSTGQEFFEGESTGNTDTETFNTNWFSMPTTDTASGSMILWAGADGTANEPQGPVRTIGGTSSGGTIKVQLRPNGNNNDIVTIYSKTGGSTTTNRLYMKTLSFEDDPASDP